MCFSFFRCCSKIKEHFDRADQPSRLQSEKDSFVRSSLIKEYGILIRNKADKGKRAENQDYWVVGRQQRQNHIKQQVFVCFLDSTPQNLIELAFCIPFGHDWT